MRKHHRVSCHLGRITLGAFLCLASLACNARLGTGGALDPNVGAQQPNQPTPKPEVWPGGFLHLNCEATDGRTRYPLSQIGMLDGSGSRFSDYDYQWAKFADEGWILAVPTFPGHTTVPGEPVAKPAIVELMYYIFHRPDPWTPENFHEIRRVLRRPFERGQRFEVKWNFTKFRLICEVKSTATAD